MEEKKDKSTESTSATLRRTYVEPRIEESAEFETLSLACSNADGVCGVIQPT